MKLLSQLDFSPYDEIENPIKNNYLYNITLGSNKLKISNFVEITDSCPNFVSPCFTE